jgi:alpha-D-xyloside xylohydrolase
VPAGLNFVASGIPYWTTDTGGYGYPDYKSTQDPEFRELFVRWLEYSTFCPLFRNHGHRADNRNEFYDFGPVEPILVSYDKLRYRMLPYIYSLAWKVTDQDYTIMRPLIMDWRNDPDVREVGDEFMFGSALLVAPVTQAHGNQREVYLPVASAWYDFWTGAQVKTGLISSEAPLDRIPVYVRAGAILPLGPELEYAAQHPEGPIELRVYRGADGHFDLYDDEGDGYGYEQKAQSIIPIEWNDAEQRLTFGPRTGSYPGMPQSIRFHVIFVGLNHGAGAAVSSVIDEDVIYSGISVQIEGNSKQHR